MLVVVCLCDHLCTAKRKTKIETKRNQQLKRSELKLKKKYQNMHITFLFYIRFILNTAKYFTIKDLQTNHDRLAKTIVCLLSIASTSSRHHLIIIESAHHRTIDGNRDGDIEQN